MTIKIGCDFDGVVMQDHGSGTMEPPLPGAIEGLQQLTDMGAVAVITARRNIQLAVDWLSLHRFEVQLDTETDHRSGVNTWTERGKILVTNRKLRCDVYLDDRGLRFENWDQAIPAVMTAVGLLQGV